MYCRLHVALLLSTGLSKAKELHVIRTPHRDRVANTRSINSLDARSVDGPSVTTLGIIGFCALWLVVVVAKHTSPLLHGFLVVLGSQSAVGGAVVDLHLGSRAVVSRVHVEDYIGPCLRGCSGLAVGACAVPCIDATTAGHEATGIDTRVGDSGLEDIWVSSGQDVLDVMLVTSDTSFGIDNVRSSWHHCWIL